MKIERMELNNYKSHKHFVADFNGINTYIKGNKGSGKTSLKDAFSWLITGSMVDDPTPVDENGVIIDHLTISVECLFEDGTILKIEDSQKWVKGVLKSKHSSTYFINKTPCLEKDYQEFLNEKIGTIEQRRILTDPSYFATGFGLAITGKTPKTATQRRREIVIGVASAEDLETAIKENEETAKQSKYALSIHKKEQDDAYAGIESLNNAKVDVSDLSVESIQSEIKKLEKEKINATKSLNALSNEDEKENLLSRNLSDAETRLSQAKSKYLSEYNNQLQASQVPYNEYQLKKSQLESNRNKLLGDSQQQEQEIQRLKSTISFQETELNKLLTAHAAEKETKYIPNSLSCMTCGQVLPSDMLLSAEAIFNKHKSDRMEQLVIEGKKVRSVIDNTTKTIGTLNRVFDYESISKEISEMVEPIIPVIPTFETTKEYNDLVVEIQSAQKLIGEKTNNEAEDMFNRTLENLQQSINDLNVKGGLFETNKHIENQIELKGIELNGIADNIDKHKEIIDECNEFTRTTLESLDTTLQEKFDNIRFKMFEYTLDGSQKDTCIVYAKTDNGFIPWESLSGGQRRSALICLSNAFNKAWGVSIPLWIDDTQIYIEDGVSANSQLIRITEVPNIALNVSN